MQVRSYPDLELGSGEYALKVGQRGLIILGMFSKLDYPKTSTSRLLPLVISIGMVKMVRCPFYNKKSNQNCPGAGSRN